MFFILNYQKNWYRSGNDILNILKKNDEENLNEKNKNLYQIKCKSYVFEDFVCYIFIICLIFKIEDFIFKL